MRWAGALKLPKVRDFFLVHDEPEAQSALGASQRAKTERGF
jgi:hypothetical protein